MVNFIRKLVGFSQIISVGGEALFFTIKYCFMCYKKNQEGYPDRLGNLTKHHLLPRSKGGLNKKNNISYVPEKLHNHWHALFSNFSPTKIAHIINEHWIPRDLTMVVFTKEEMEAIRDTLSKLHLSKY